MLKDDMLDSIEEIKEILEDADFKSVTNEQKETLRNNFNKAFNFDYCEDGGYIFLMNESNFKNFEYYMGMEYANNDIETKINLDETILVIYSSDCERAKELINLLNESEEAED